MALNLPRVIKRLAVLLLDIFLCIFTVLGAFYLRLGQWIPIFGDDDWNASIVILAAILLGVPIFIGFGLYRQIFRYSGISALTRIAQAMCLYALIFIFIFTVFGVKGVPRTIGFIQPMILFLFIALSRFLASYWLSSSYRKRLRREKIPRVLIYGAGDAGRQLAGALAHSNEMHVVGFLDDDRDLHGQTLEGVRVFNPDRLADLVSSLSIAEVLLAIPSASRSRRNEILRQAHGAKVSIQTLPGLSELASRKVTTQDLKPLDIADLLGRDLIRPDSMLLRKSIEQKVVLITGAGGSIGSELCRQILELSPQKLILVEQSEFGLYQIHQELVQINKNINRARPEIIPLLASVTNEARMRLILAENSPDVIYHAAAYKHVPLVEFNPVEGVRNNVVGTLIMSRLAIEFCVSRFILISTDKAVRPTNVMGASKRLAEMVLQALATTKNQTCFAMVRFGNVLNSSGSVVPLFRQQIKDGGPITITDFRITRFFMAIPEAAQLVIQASALAQGGDVFLLDMGEPVKIIDLARRMIELSGLDVKDSLNPDGDIEIAEIGLRPGEKLYEELLINGNPEKTSHQRIFKSREDFLSWSEFEPILEHLNLVIDSNDRDELIKILVALVSGYVPANLI